MNDSGRRILLGRVIGAFGVRGEIKLESFTEPREQILRYQPWTLRDARGGEREVSGVRARQTAKGVVARIACGEDRHATEALLICEQFAPLSVLPPPEVGEYYWVDLEGVRVRNLDGDDLGTFSHLFSTGANDVVLVREGTDGRER